MKPSFRGLLCNTPGLLYSSRGLYRGHQGRSGPSDVFPHDNSWKDWTQS